MPSHTPLLDVFVSTLADARVLDYRLVELDEQFLLLVRTHARDSRQLREILRAELWRSDKPVTVVLSSSGKQELDYWRWKRTRHPALNRQDAARLRSCLLT